MSYRHLQVITPMPSDRQVIHIIEAKDCIRLSLSSLLQKQQYMVYEYSTGLEFLQNIPPISHGCILLNLNLPNMNGLELQSILVKRHYPLPRIFLSDQHNVTAAVQAMKNGAFDFMEIPLSNEALILSIRKALDANWALIRKTMAIESLTSREQDVAKLVLEGKLNKEAAYLLNISEKTIEFHRKNIREKLSSYSDVINI
jgi:two-component system, LuxR family, response regulator FixJ